MSTRTSRKEGSSGGNAGVSVGGGNNGSNVCDVCAKTFTSASALRRHTMSKHSALSVKYACSTCGMSYKTKWSLSTHISRYHRPQSEKMIRRKIKRENDETGEGESFVVVKSD